MTIHIMFVKNRTKSLNYITWHETC
jgi:hypothetical protein